MKRWTISLGMMMFVVLVALTVQTEGAWKAATWKYNTGDLYGSGCLQAAVDEFDSRLDNMETASTNNLLPATDGTYNIGSSSLEWQDGWFDGHLNVDTITNSADIIMGRALATLTVTGDITANGNIVGDGSTIVTNMAAAYFASVQLTGNVVANGNIVGDDATVVTNMAVVEADAYWIAGAAGLTTNQSFLAITGTTNTAVFVSGVLTAVN